MEKYSYTIRILHWFMAILIIGMLCIGITMTNIDNQKIKSLLFAIHESVGVTILILALIRVIVRLNTKIPELSQLIPILYRKLSRAVHYILYFFMFFIPLVGFFGSILQGYPVIFYGLEIPVFVSVNKAVGETLMKLHEIAPYIFIMFIILHIAAFIRHQYFDKIDIFSPISWKK